MSNCIELKYRTEWVTFPASVIDAAKLQQIIASCDPAKKLDTTKDHVTYWFLTSENVTFQPDGSVMIIFGKGRSSHTWRDFELTLAFLRDNVINQPFTHTFMISDEMDNHASVGRFPVDFKQFQTYYEKKHHEHVSYALEDLDKDQA